MNNIATATQTKWTVDKAHTEVEFKARHLVISTVSGQFKEFDGVVHTHGEGLEGAEVDFTIQAASIDTNNTDRDNHLRSDDFFNAEKFPEIKFCNGTLDQKEDDKYLLKGELTIRDITRPVELEVVYGGSVTDPYGNEKAGFEVKGKINRKDYNLSWNAVTEAGNVVVGDTIRIQVNVQFTKVEE